MDVENRLPQDIAWDNLLQEQDLVGWKIFTQCQNGSVRGTITRVDHEPGKRLAIYAKDEQVRRTGEEWFDVEEAGIAIATGGLIIPGVPWSAPEVGDDGVIRAYSRLDGGIEIHPIGYAGDESPMYQPLTTEHVKDVCRFYDGPGACSYLALGADGVECHKNDAGGAGLAIRMRREAGTIKAMGDHCEGRCGTAELPKRTLSETTEAPA